MKNSDYKFENPYIKENTFKLNDEFIAGGNISLKTRVQAYNNYNPEKSKDTAVGGIIIEVGEETGEAPFYIKLIMEAKFHWEDKSEDAVSSFLKINAPALLTGYARPIISFLTANSPYPPFHLSFINFKE